MTEDQWLTGTDPQAMLAFCGGGASDRKVRLFACACVRGLWEWLGDASSQAAVSLAEAYADGRIERKELEAAAAAARLVQVRAEEDLQALERQERDADFFEDQPRATRLDFAGRLARAARQAAAARMAAQVAGFPPVNDASKKGYKPGQCTLLRDIFGNPFRPVRLDPLCLQGKESTMVRLAQSIYHRRGFTDLPLLADALEEAGCADEQVLSHCRGPGPHGRGCFVVDLILGKS